MEQNEPIKLKIDEEFRSLIRPLYRQEYLQLEANILADGCLTPIITWNGIIVDGHNRYEICTKHKISYPVEEKHFECREEVVAWICANQLGRRNLSEETRKFLIGLQYENEKIVNEKKNVLGINQHSQKLDINPAKEEELISSRSRTATRIANTYHISRSTVEKYANYTRALEIIGKKEPKLVPKILSGRYKVSHNGVVELAKLSASDVQSINRRLERTGPEFARYQTTRKEINQTQKSKDIKRADGPVTSIKDMPKYDPDAEVTGLSLTIPSWSGSIHRIEQIMDFNSVSPEARAKLLDVLMDLQNSAMHMLIMLRRYQDG